MATSFPTGFSALGAPSSSWKLLADNGSINGTLSVSDIANYIVSGASNGMAALTYASSGTNLTIKAQNSTDVPLAVASNTSNTVFSVNNAGTITAGLIGGGNGITASAPTLNIRQRMNNAAVAFTLAVFNLEDQNSAANSKIIDAQLSGTTNFALYKSSAVFPGLWMCLGNGISTSVDPAIAITRQVGNSTGVGTGNAHAFVDSTIVNRTGTIGYASYDAAANIGAASTLNFDHTVSFQARLNLNFTGTITNLYGFYDVHTIATCTVTNKYGVYIETASVTTGGVITNNYGVYVNTQTAGTNNFGIYVNGSTPSYFGGDVTCAGTLIVAGGSTAVLKSTNTVTSGAGAQIGSLSNCPVSGNPTSWIPFNDNGTTRYIPSW